MQRTGFSHARFESKAQGEGVITCARNKVGPDSRRAGGTAATAARARSLGDRAQVVEHRTRVRHLARM